jgi:cytochrome c
VRRFFYIAFVLAASLLLARVHPFGDAGLYAGTGVQTPLMEHSSVSPEARELLVQKCADCHSMQTRPHFYGRLAPVSWLLERDILKGRRAMNLSEWDSYSADQQQTFAAKIVEKTKAHEMPLLQYRMIHWNARVTDADEQVLTQWAHGASLIATSGVGQAASDGDAARGKDVFEKRCTGCHAMAQDREGPRLQGVYGRVSGTVAGFPYSDALKKAHVVWDDGSLEKWLADPDAFLPGNNMDFLVTKPQERKDLIAYFKQVGGK